MFLFAVLLAFDMVALAFMLTCAGMAFLREFAEGRCRGGHVRDDG